MLDRLTVTVYEPDGYQQTRIEVRIGDRVNCKPSGCRGSTFGVITRLAEGSRGISVRSDSGGRAVAMRTNALIRAWRDGVLLGVPAPFTGAVLQFDVPVDSRDPGWLEVARAGKRNLGFNRFSPGWPQRALTLGEVVTMEMRAVAGSDRPVWFVV